MAPTCSPTDWEVLFPLHRMVVIMDASLTSWGAVLGSRSALDFWTLEGWLLIKVLGLGVIRLSLDHCKNLLRGILVRSQSDNAPAVAYVNHQGGMSSGSGSGGIKHFAVAEQHVLVLTAILIPRHRDLVGRLFQSPNKGSGGVVHTPCSISSALAGGPWMGIFWHPISTGRYQGLWREHGTPWRMH